jgi:hypothetical protein
MEENEEWIATDLAGRVVTQSEYCSRVFPDGVRKLRKNIDRSPEMFKMCRSVRHKFTCFRSSPFPVYIYTAQM